MKLNDCNILYINLKRRKDRNNYIKNQLDQLGLKYKRINAVDGRNFTQDEKDFYNSRSNFNVMDKNKDQIYGKAGCYLSHMNCLKHAIDNKYQNLLVIEDDCTFLTDKNPNYKFDIPKDTYLYYLGGLFWPKTKPFIPKNEYTSLDNIPIDTEHFKIACTVAYIIPTYDRICEVYNIMTSKMKKAVDMMYVCHIQKKYPCYIHNPPLCLQSDFVSDVTNLDKKTPKKPFNNDYFYVKDKDNEKNARKFWKQF